MDGAHRRSTGRGSPAIPGYPRATNSELGGQIPITVSVMPQALEIVVPT